MLHPFSAVHTPPLPNDLPLRTRVNANPDVEHPILRDGGAIPNNVRLPLMVYRRVLRMPSEDPASAWEQIFKYWNWLGQWRNGIYPFHHYHSTSHEALGVYAGQARVRLGGEGEVGFTTDVGVGDVLVIPAGVGHCNLGSSADFGVVGAYPEGRKWDLLRGNPGERPQADVNIAHVPLPANDPVFGPDGPLRMFWQD